MCGLSEHESAPERTRHQGILQYFLSVARFKKHAAIHFKHRPLQPSAGAGGECEAQSVDWHGRH